MDREEKRKLANEKRLQAIQQWKQNQNNNYVKIKNSPKKKIKNDVAQSNRLTLFASDDEEEKFDNCFDIRPQFEGPRGQHLLEMSSQFSSRFKLDERFNDDEEQLPIEENDEKMKNLKILESIIGHEIRKPPVDGRNMKKRQIRFDPEDESSSKYVKTSNVSNEKSKKNQRKKKVKNVSELPEDIPISSERYVEVTPNLKDILSSASGPFSLSHKFYGDNEPEYNHKEHHAFKFTEKEKEGDDLTKSTIHLKNYTNFKKSNNILFERKVKSESFFLTEDDPRLKEGIEFFIRPKPLDELREEWKIRREIVTKMFMRKKRSRLEKPQKVKTKNVTKYTKK